MDPALAFWLRHVAAEGGLWEPAGDSTYVVLPPALRDAYRLQEELHITADPDVAREDGATLLALGHPVLAEAAERVLASGDAGRRVLARPASVRPGTDILAAGVRDAFPVDHGRIDLAGEPAFVWHPVVRVGALVSYMLSAEDHFQEQAERSCGGDAPLVAGKQKLGCERCLPRTPGPTVSSPASPAAKAAKAHPPTPPPAPAIVPPAARSPRPASVPPAVRRQPPPVPPHVRKERRTAPGKLAERLWNAVAAGRAGGAGAVLAPGSPAAALHGVLGGPGLTRVIGLPDGEAPARFRPW